MIGIPVRKHAPKGDVAQHLTNRGGPGTHSLLIATCTVRRAETRLSSSGERQEATDGPD